MNVQIAIILIKQNVNAINRHQFIRNLIPCTTHSPIVLNLILIFEVAVDLTKLASRVLNRTCYVNTNIWRTGELSQRSQCYNIPINAIQEAFTIIT